MTGCKSAVADSNATRYANQAVTSPEPPPEGFDRKQQLRTTSHLTSGWSHRVEPGGGGWGGRQGGGPGDISSERFIAVC